MRRMSSGAGGSAGGQLFNIGKSKAKLFDEKTDVKTSFKDVAGLEGLKRKYKKLWISLKTQKNIHLWEVKFLKELCL